MDTMQSDRSTAASQSTDHVARQVRLSRFNRRLRELSETELSDRVTLAIQAISRFSPRCLTSEMTEIGVTRSNRSEAARL